MTAIEPPLAVLLELTHRCPLKCPYCYNPLTLARSSAELDRQTWQRVISEAADMGVHQVHFSGGEPLVRKDIVDLVGHAATAGLYTNLITSGVTCTEPLLDDLLTAGLDHVQLSFQGAEPEVGNRIGGYAGGHEKKLLFASWLKEREVPLTLNAVMHRQNLHQLEDVLSLAERLGARRLEVAHTQYYGWGLKNRAALMPTREQVKEATRIVEAARERLKGRMVIDYVVPDYYARRPKACMGGWGRQFMTVTPDGEALPCHAAQTLPDLAFDRVTEKSLDDIWRNSEAFNLYRGTAWMPEPCASCERREIDWGGCRCQALALTGDAARTDPACALSPDHEAMVALATGEAEADSDSFDYRRF